MYVVVCRYCVYAVCMCGRRFNRSPIHIKGVGFAKVLGVLCEIDVRWVQIAFAKVQGVLCESDVDNVDWFYPNPGVLHKITVNRVHVDFFEVQGVFCIIYIHEVRGSFAKLSSMGCELILPKFRRFFFFFCKIYVPTVLDRQIGQSDSQDDLGWCGQPPV